MSALERMVDALRNAGQEPTEPRAYNWRARCPAHEGQSATSLSVKYTEGRVLVHCFGGCDTPTVLDALGLGMADLWDEPRDTSYPYADGRRVHRDWTKRFWQSGKTKSEGAVLYRLDLVTAAVAAGRVVYVVEGEQDVHAVEAEGAVGTCSPGGAGKWGRVDDTPLHGAQVVIVRDKDTAGHKHAAQVAESLHGHVEALVVVEALVGKDTCDHVAAGHGLDELVPVDEPEPVTATPALSVTRLSDVVPERVTWAWPRRIPAGKLVTLDGDPSLGKSTLALNFAAIITTGGTWPDGTTCEHSGDVVLLAAEDGLADTIRPRLDVAGADCTRVHAVQGVRQVDPDTGETYLRPPTLGDVAALRELVVRVGARLLIVDVLMAYLPSGVDSHKDQDIRRVLSGLASLAEDTGCTVLLLRHLNKAKGGDPMYRGGGSIGIVGAARSGLLVARDPEDDDLRVLASTKSNLGATPDALTYRLVDADAFGVARVQWVGTSTHDARALLAEHDQREDSPERDAAAEWLEDYLTAEGKAPSKSVKAAARKDAGISEATLKRAAQQLGVQYAQEGFPRTTYWALPDREPTEPTGPRPLNREPTGDREPTGSDLRKHHASRLASPQSAQLAHGSERRADWPDAADLPVEQDTTREPGAGCSVCSAPLTDARARLTRRCSRLDAAHQAARAQGGAA